MTDYLLRPTNGNDSNDGLTFANSFLTLQKLVDTVGAGDRGIMIPEQVETTATTINFDTQTGTVQAPITLLTGNTTDGTIDYSLTYTIQASSTMTGLVEFDGARDYYKIYNLFMDGNSTGGATNPLYNNTDGSDQNAFINCRTANGLGDGVNIRGAGRWFFFDCESDNNVGNGHDHTSGSRGIRSIIGGSIHDNTANGAVVSVANCHFFNVEIYDNGQDGITSGTSANDFLTLYNNTIYGNNGDGVQLLNTTENLVMINNSFASNGGYGLHFNTGSDTDVLIYFDYNHFDDNTSGDSDQTLPGQNNISGDPLFTSISDGSEDFIPLSTSPLNRAGQMGQTIGARQSADPAGGGGGTIGSGLLHGLIG